MLIDQQNLHVPRSKQRINCCEALSHGPGPQSKNIPCIIK
jgi:hypothetical protein